MSPVPSPPLRRRRQVLMATAGAVSLWAVLGTCREAPEPPRVPVTRTGMVGVPAKAGPPPATLVAVVSSSLAATAEARPDGSLEPGGRVRGTLQPSPEGAAQGPVWEGWRLDVPEASEVQATLEGDGFDPFLVLYRGRPGELATAVEWDDAGGAGLGASLSASVGAGAYTLVAAARDGGTGSYRLSLDVTPSSEGGGLPHLGPGTFGGELSEGDPVLPDSSRYDVWSYHGTSGERLTVGMRSSEVDAFLVLLLGSPASGAFIAEDDDGGGFPDARLSVVLPATGTYTLLAGTHGTGETGGYELTVSAARAPSVAYDNTGPSTGRYALVVGIGDYPGTENDVAGPVRDAEAFRDLLVTRFGFRDEDVVLLTDGDATRENIANGILQHLGQAGPEGVAVFFHSGLGIHIGLDLGLAGALDPDAPGTGDDALYLPAPGGGASILLEEELAYLLASLEAGRSLVVLDASFGGDGARGPSGGRRPKGTEMSEPQVASALRLPANFIGVEPAVARPVGNGPLSPEALASIPRSLEGLAASAVWRSSGPGETSWAAAGEGDASPFSQFLVARLAGAAPTATLQQLQDEVAADLAAGAAEEGLARPQRPQLRGPDLGLTLDALLRAR